MAPTSTNSVAPAESFSEEIASRGLRQLRLVTSESIKAGDPAGVVGRDYRRRFGKISEHKPGPKFPSSASRRDHRTA